MFEYLLKEKKKGWIKLTSDLLHKVVFNIEGK